MSDPKELPEGYVRVSLLVTEAEYLRLQRTRKVTPRGTMSEAIRYTMGWTYVPHNFLRAAGITQPAAKKKTKPFEVRNKPLPENVTRLRRRRPVAGKS